MNEIKNSDTREIIVGITEASEYLGQTTKTLQRWDNNGTLRAHHTKGGNRYYYQNELDVMKRLLSSVTRKEAAEQIGVSEKTLWRWDKSGTFKSRYTIGITSYYFQEDIDRCIEKRSNRKTKAKVGV